MSEATTTTTTAEDDATTGTGEFIEKKQRRSNEHKKLSHTSPQFNGGGGSSKRDSHRGGGSSSSNNHFTKRESHHNANSSNGHGHGATAIGSSSSSNGADNNNNNAAAAAAAAKTFADRLLSEETALRAKYGDMTTKDATSLCFTLLKGDLFSASEDTSLAHCVSEDFRMGAGIATEFKKRFDRVNELLSQSRPPPFFSFLFLVSSNLLISCFFNLKQKKLELKNEVD